jgi:hypothetical protein
MAPPPCIGGTTLVHHRPPMPGRIIWPDLATGLAAVWTFAYHWPASSHDLGTVSVMLPAPDWPGWFQWHGHTGVGPGGRRLECAAVAGRSAP